MVRRILSAGWPFVLAAAGCFPNQESTLLVPGNTFGTAPATATATKTSYAPASTEAATRVGLVGQKILAANPQLALRPSFSTIGAPQAEIFHRGASDVFITEGLVRQCTSEGQLAAVLCQELGKIVAERDALSGALGRSAAPLPPMDTTVGNDTAGSAGLGDLGRQTELAKYEKEYRRRPSGDRIPLPDPKTLAANYLTKAGYTPADLDAAVPLLRSADENVALEKQLTTSPTPRPWGP